jgi:hypothetical protein
VKNLVSNSLFLLLFVMSGCSVSMFNGYHKQNEPAETLPEFWFHADSGYFLFSTGIDLMKNRFTGLMVVKPGGNNSYRVIFITEMGLKIFDMEFFPDRDTQVHYIMEAMNKKALVKTLVNDMSLVLMNHLPGLQPILYSHKNSPDNVFRYQTGCLKTYYHVTDSVGKPYMALQTGCLTNKVKADIYGNNITGVDSVKLEHYNFRLSIKLKRILE